MPPPVWKAFVVHGTTSEQAHMSHPDVLEPQLAFAELAGITLADHDLRAVMDKVVHLAQRTIPGAAEVSVTLVESGHPTTAAHTGDVALRLDERQYDTGYGPCLDCIGGSQALIVTDMASDTRWPDWAREALGAGVFSSMSIPVPLQRTVSGALNIYCTEPHGLDDHAVELAATFAAYAGVALANMHLYTAQSEVAGQLQKAMESRAVIEQAKGVVMAQRRCGSDEAFNLLVQTSQHENRKLRDLAQSVVDRATKGAS